MLKVDEQLVYYNRKNEDGRRLGYRPPYEVVSEAINGEYRRR